MRGKRSVRWTAAVCAAVAAVWTAHAAATFRLKSVGTCETAWAPAAWNSDKEEALAAVPESVRGTPFGRTLALVPHYFAGALMDRRDSRTVVADDGAQYLVTLRFSDPGYSEQTNFVATSGARRLVTTRRLTMAAAVRKLSGELAAAKTFEETFRGEYQPPETKPAGDANSVDRMVREALADFAKWLKTEFACP